MWPSDCWVTAYVALEQKSLETPGLDSDTYQLVFKAVCVRSYLAEFCETLRTVEKIKLSFREALHKLWVILISVKLK